MSGNNIDKLCQSLLETVENISAGDRDGKTDKGLAAHIELLDIDKFRLELTEAVELLRSDLSDSREIDFARQWLDSRISSLIRARRVLAPGDYSKKNAVSHIEKPLAELIRIFENESAGLRQVISNNSNRTQSGAGNQSDYRQFKS